MTKRAKVLVASIVLLFCAVIGWKLYQDAREPLVTNQPLPAYVPDETTKEPIELWPAQRDGKWGYINRAGEFVIPPQFEMAWEFAEGLAPVQIRQDSLRFGNDRKYGFINKTGQMVIPARFTHQGFPDGFRDGLARIVSKPLRLLKVNWVREKYGFIDRDGKTVIETKYDFAGAFHEGLARAMRRQGLSRKSKWGFINRKGETVIGYEFDFAGDFAEGLAAVQKENAHYFIDTSGKDVFGKRFDGAHSFAEGLAAVQVGRKWGYINQVSEVVIPPQFKTAKLFSEGLAAIQTMDDKWGFIDRTGKIVLPPTYQGAHDFSEGAGAVKINDKWGVIDKAGKLICEPQFQGIFGIAWFKNGVARVSIPVNEQRGRFAYIDKSGKIFWRAD